MKKIANYVVLIAGFLLVFVSCNKDEAITNDSSLIKSYDFFSRKVTDPSIINKFTSRVTSLKSSDGITFDTQNVYEVGISDTSATVFYVNQLGFDEQNDSNYGLACPMDKEGNFGEPTIIQTELVDGMKIINYFDNSNNLILSLGINTETEEIETLFKLSLKSTGQDTMDCIADAYTNHGWASVFAWVSTAFVPEVAAAIAADCLLHQL